MTRPAKPYTQIRRFAASVLGISDSVGRDLRFALRGLPRRPAFETPGANSGLRGRAIAAKPQQRRGLAAWHTACKSGGMQLLADLARDFRYSARALARTPGFTVVAVAVLALGIGATSAIFSLVSAVWLKPLPFADAERIVSIWVDLTATGGPATVNIAPGHYADWQERARSFESLSPLEPLTLNLTGDGGEPERLIAIRTSESLFETIGLPPLLGRTFAPGDAGDNAVVVSEGFWLRRLGGDPAAVGRTITLDGSPHSIVGVVPRDFRFPQGESDVFIPTAFAPDILANHRSYVWWLVGKLRAGVTLEAAQTEMNAIAAALEADHPQTGRGAAANLVPLREQLAGEVRPTMLALIGAVAFVLLIACANVANLMLARATTRQKELAIRKALGAARGRVLRQLLAESCVLAASGVVIGIFMAAACVGYIARLIPNTFPASTSTGLNLSVVAFTVGIAVVTVLLFGAGPALVAARRDFGAAFGRAVGTHGRGTRRLRMALVVGEIALTVVLLAGAGLLLRSYQAVLAVDPGFDADGLLLAETALAPSQYANPADRDAFYRRVLERVSALPGVENAGYTGYAPLLFDGGRAMVLVEGRPRPEGSEVSRSLALNRGVSSRYFATLGVPLVRGRFLDERDTRSSDRTVVINETMARRFWPDDDPLGRRFSIAGPGGPMTVVGVVGDVQEIGLDVPAESALYMSLDQTTIPFMWPRQLVVRTDGDPAALAPAVRRAIWEVDANQPVSNLRPMSEVLDAELNQRNTQLTLLGAFALVALVLAAVGLYGTLSYTVSQNTAEIGLRLALGAEQRAVVGSVVRTALGTAALGIVIGLVAALVLTETIASLLYAVSPTDPLTVGGVALALLGVTVLAAFLPARRAARIDPAATLRAEN
jgi:predicted permease